VSSTQSEPSRALSRRAILSGALAGASLPVWSGFAASSLTSPAAAATTLPTVTPKWSEQAANSFGVCTMPMQDKTVYHYRSAWVANLAGIGVRNIRGTYQNGFDPTYETIALLRKHGMKWGMNVVPDLGISDAAIRAKVADIAAKAADVCLYIEGINEPNYNRNGSRVSSTWKEQTLHKQQVVWQAVKSHPQLSHVAVLGPSLQTTVVTTSDYQWFGSHGLPNYMTHAGSHCYPSGSYPDSKFGSMLKPLIDNWHRPIWITETGYSNALAFVGGQKPVPEDIAAIYAPSAVLEAVDRGWHTTWFEALDDVDAGSKNDIEANWGLWATGATAAPPWRAKPTATALKALLTGLRDPGPAYSPAPIKLRVTAPVSDVRWTALGKRDGSVRLYLRRSKPCYDPLHKVRISVAPVAVTIATAKGNRTVSVGSKVVTVTL